MDISRALQTLSKRYPNKRVLVTGATSGLGEALAMEFAGAGQIDYAVDALELLFAGPSFITFRFVEIHPAFDDIRDDPRYLALRRKYGTPQK